MLVLGRRSGQTITFPDLDIEVAVVSIIGDKVRIGIVAPASVRILRTEIMERYHDDANEEAEAGDA
jgi:carbon storage regulator